MTIIGRLKDGDLLLSNTINERIPAVTNGLVAHFPFDGTCKTYIPGQIRYIRDWLNGSTANTGNHWVEIQAFDFNGNNVALNKSGTSSYGTWNALLTDGITTTSPYWEPGPGFVQVDLGNAYTLEKIKVWHYYSDNRTYHNTKTQVSQDGISWFTIFDSAIEGEYQEHQYGRVHYLNQLGKTAYHQWNPVSWKSLAGVSVDGNSITKTNGSAAWDSGAISNEQFNGNVSLQWQFNYVDSSHGAEMIGFNHDNSTSNFNDIDYAIYTHYNGEVQVYENGASKGIKSTWDLKSSNIFRIDVINNTVNYYHNNNLIYTSVTAPIFPLYADCSLHCHGAQNSIINVVTKSLEVSNITLSYDGVAIEEATTNILLNPFDFNAWGVSKNSGSNPTIESNVGISPIGDMTADKITIPNDGTYPRLYQNWTPANTNTHTISIWLKSAMSGACSTTLYVFRNSPWGLVAGSGIIITITDEWKQYSFSFTPLDTTSHQIYLGSHDTTKGMVFYAWGAQLEQKSFATFPVNSSRSGNGLVDIDIPNLQTFSLAFKFKPDAEYYKVLAAGYNKIMLSMYDTDLTRKIDYTDYTSAPGPSATISYPFFDLEPNTSWDNVTHHWHHTYGYVKNEWHDYFIIKSIDTLRIYVVLNGVILRNQTFNYFDSSILTNFALKKLRLGTSWSGVFKDFSIYNKELLDNEITKLCKNKFSITSTGNINSLNIVEKYNRLPTDAIYFPLDYNSQDQYKIISPNIETDTVYENGKLWVGKATTNLSLDSFNSSFDNSGTSRKDSNSTEINKPYSNSQLHVLEKLTDGNSAMTIGQATVTASTVYSLSVWAYFDTVDGEDGTFPRAREYYSGGNIILGPLIYYDESGHAISSFAEVPKKRWIKLVKSNHTTRADATSMSISSYLNKTGSKLYLTAPQIEIGTYVSPFVIGTRPYSKLTYNTLASKLNNWNEFTIIMWATYSQNDIGRLSGTWLKFYFGINSLNKVSFSWTQDGVQKGPYTGTSIIPINQKVMIGCSVKNQFFIDLYYNGIRELNYTTAFNMNDTPTDFMLNSVSPGSTSYPLNAYVDGLIFIPRAIDQTEMKNIYKTQMSSYLNKLQIQGKVIENIIF